MIRLLEIILLALALALPAAAEAHEVKLGLAMPGDMIDMTPDQGGEPTASAFRAASPSASIIRTGLRWNTVQDGCAQISAHSYDWAGTDRLMELYLDEGVTPLFTLGAVPKCAAVAHNPAFEPAPRYARAFATFAMKVVERYGPGGSFFELHPEWAGSCCPVTYIEIWNEPNLTKKWSRADPRDYAGFFMDVADRIREADNFSPQVKVITGGVTGLNGGDWKTNGRAYVRGLVRVRGLSRAADGIGIHTYSPNARQAMRNVKAVRRILDRHGAQAPIEITEHGWSTCPRPGDPRANGKCVSPAGQAKRLETLVRGLTSRRNRNLDVRSFLWFMAQDESTAGSVADCPSSPKNFYGLWGHDGSPKRVRSVWQHVTGVTLPPSIPAAPQLHGCSGRWG